MTSIPDEHQVPTVFEVAAIMRVSKQTVYRLVQSGDMEAIEVGGSYRIPRARAWSAGTIRHREYASFWSARRTA